MGQAGGGEVITQRRMWDVARWPGAGWAGGAKGGGEKDCKEAQLPLSQPPKEVGSAGGWGHLASILLVEAELMSPLCCSQSLKDS